MDNLIQYLMALPPDEIHQDGTLEFYLGPVFLSERPPEFTQALSAVGWVYGDSVRLVPTLQLVKTFPFLA